MSNLEGNPSLDTAALPVNKSKPIKLIRSWERVRQSARANSESSGVENPSLSQPPLQKSDNNLPEYAESSVSDIAPNMSKAEEETSRVVDELFREFLAQKMEQIETEHQEKVMGESRTAPDDELVVPKVPTNSETQNSNQVVNINSQTSLIEQERIKHKFDNMKKEIIENANKVKVEKNDTNSLKSESCKTETSTEKDGFIGPPNRSVKSEDSDGIFADAKVNAGAKKPALKLGLLGIKISQTSAELISSGTKVEENTKKSKAEDGRYQFYSLIY